VFFLLRLSFPGGPDFEGRSSWFRGVMKDIGQRGGFSFLSFTLRKTLARALKRSRASIKDTRGFFFFPLGETGKDYSECIFAIPAVGRPGKERATLKPLPLGAC